MSSTTEAPLASWRDTATTRAILGFVESTLWTEKPLRIWALAD